MCRTWELVPAQKTKLEDCLHVFPSDNDDPCHLDTAVTNDALKATARDSFFGMPPEVECCMYGSKILVHNPERNNSLEDRARHLSHFRDYRSGQWNLDVDKCRWLPSIPKTLTSAAAVFEDRQNDTVVFVKNYASKGIHCVVVKPKKGGYIRGAVSGYLITQFGHTNGGRQDVLRMIWKRPK